MTERGHIFWRHTLLSKISIHSEGLLAQFAQNHTDLFKIAQGRTDLRKVAKIHTKSLKVAQICPKLHKVTQICPNYTLIEILLKKVRHEKCDP